MKIRLLTFALLSLAGPGLAHAAQLSAYDALRTIGRAKGDALLSKLVEMHARGGDPQPVRWVASFKDDSARGGIREFTVDAKGVTAERTPLQAGALAAPGAMAAASLNLDSTGVFAAANKQASKAGMGFHTLSYRLQNRNGSPVWTAQLFDAAGIEVGMAEFSAKTGANITPLRAANAAVPSAPAADRPAVAPSAPMAQAGEERPLGQRWVEGGGLFGHVGRWSGRAWKTTSDTAVKVGDSVSAFFTGRPAGQTEGAN